MKKILGIASLAFPLYLNAMDLDGTDIKGKVISPLKQMDEEKLSQFSKTICDNFQALEKADVVYLPFTPKQAIILNYTFSKIEDVTDIAWKIFIPSFPSAPLYFTHLLQFYASLQAIKPPRDTMSFSTIKSPSSQDWAPFISDMIPYALAYSGRKVLSKDPFYTKKLLSDPLRVKQIYSHGIGLQQSLSCLAKVTPWNLLEMRYHLHELSSGFGIQSMSGEQTTDLDHSTYFDLFSGHGIDLQNLTLSVKDLSQTLQKELHLPLQEDPSELVAHPYKGSYITLGTIKKCNRQKLKVLFNQLPHLTLWKKLQKDKETITNVHKVMDFWKLYLDLSKNYHIYEKFHKSSAMENDHKELRILCQKVLPLKEVLTDDDLLKIIDHKSLKGMLECFANPFALHFHEILAFQYHTAQLCDVLNSLKKPLKKDLPSLQDQGDSGSFFGSWFG